MVHYSDTAPTADATIIVRSACGQRVLRVDASAKIKFVTCAACRRFEHGQCERCDVALTPTDHEVGFCTNCNTPTKEGR